MPVKSAKQLGLMYAAKAGKLRGVGGPSPEVAKEFLEKTSHEKRKKFGKALARGRKRPR